MTHASFDIVSKVDRQEVDNALNQAREGDRAALRLQERRRIHRWSGEAIEMAANSEDRVKAVLDVFQEKLIKRGDLTQGPGRRGAGSVRQGGPIAVSPQGGHRAGGRQEIAKIIRDEGPKGIKAQVQGDELRGHLQARTTCRRRSPCSRARTWTSRSSSSNYR